MFGIVPDLDGSGRRIGVIAIAGFTGASLADRVAQGRSADSQEKLVPRAEYVPEYGNLDIASEQFMRCYRLWCRVRMHGSHEQSFPFLLNIDRRCLVQLPMRSS